MGLNKILNIEDVAAWRLCCGCGACAYISSDEIEMIDTLEYGRRPRFKDGLQRDPRSQEGMKVCPGIELTRTFDPNQPGLIKELLPAWGPVLEVWEGYAVDPEIRCEGTSGGVATALALYAIERKGMCGTLHIKARHDVPYLNHTVLSTTRKALLAGAGSRYAPASPCDGLKMIEEAPRPCVFIGKPCDVAAVQKTLSLRPKLAEKVGLTIAFFCAGTPTTIGTLKMLQAMGIEDSAAVRSVRYRGRGWPGMATVTFSRNGTLETRQLTYEQSWGEILQKYRPWRCYICADHTGEFADIAIADAWHRSIEQGQPGLSVIITRNEKGKQFLKLAQDAGYLKLEPAKPEILPACRSGQSASLGNLWGRLVALELFGVPAPQYEGVKLFGFWWRDLGLKQKIKSIGGTVKRIFHKRLYQKQFIQSCIKSER